MVSSHTATFWKIVWNSPSIPKVNFFTWILMHKKALTGDNLSKRGFLDCLDVVFVIKLPRLQTISLLAAFLHRKLGHIYCMGCRFQFLQILNLFVFLQTSCQGILEFFQPVMNGGKFGNPFQNFYGGKFG